MHSVSLSVSELFSKSYSILSHDMNVTEIYFQPIYIYEASYIHYCIYYSDSLGKLVNCIIYTSIIQYIKSLPYDFIYNGPKTFNEFYMYIHQYCKCENISGVICIH